MKKPTLSCPHCGWNGRTPGQYRDGFLYLEEVTNERRVLGFNEDDRLLIDGHDHLNVEDNGANHRFLCGHCMSEFPIPEDTEIDFVA